MPNTPNPTFYSFVDVRRGVVVGPLCPSVETAEVYRRAYAGRGYTVCCTVKLHDPDGAESACLVPGPVSSAGAPSNAD